MKWKSDENALLTPGHAYSIPCHGLLRRGYSAEPPENTPPTLTWGGAGVLWGFYCQQQTVQLSNFFLGAKCLGQRRRHRREIGGEVKYECASRSELFSVD